MRPLAHSLAGFGLTCLLALPMLRAAEPPASDDAAAKQVVALTLDEWKTPQTNWEDVSDVEIDPKNPKALAGKEGSGAFYNGPGGRALNLISKEEFGDVELRLEFNIPTGSNSGVKLEGVYEIQIFDSYGAKTLDGATNGGVYPRSEMFPKYHHIDDGIAPKSNASIPPGEWQTLEITFQAPRVDESGKKTANAKFVKVILNGKLIHENLEVPCPTGSVWRNKENPKGPILLQGDHGPVAFRNVRARRLS